MILYLNYKNHVYKVENVNGVVGSQKKPKTFQRSLSMTTNLDLCFLEHLLLQLRLI